MVSAKQKALNAWKATNKFRKISPKKKILNRVIKMLNSLSNEERLYKQFKNWEHFIFRPRPIHIGKKKN
jgi:hypothetical protein